MHEFRESTFGNAIAALLAAEPELIDRAKATARRWLTLCAPAVQPALWQWLQTLDGPMKGVIAVLTSSDQWAVELRQSNPFAGVLPEQQRLAILRQFHAYDKSAA